MRGRTNLLGRGVDAAAAAETASSAGGASSRSLSSDRAESGVVDIYTRECLAIESEQRSKEEDVVRVRNRIKQRRGAAKMLYARFHGDANSRKLTLGLGQKARPINAINFLTQSRTKSRSAQRYNRTARFCQFPQEPSPLLGKMVDVAGIEPATPCLQSEKEKSI